MISFVQGEFFESKSYALVNTINCVGVMGRGIALEFKTRYPAYFQSYKKACDNKQVRPGTLHVYRKDNSAVLIGFPTKDHWRNPSKLEWIGSGLKSLRGLILELEIPSISIPALGCSNGGLNWSDVKPLIEKELTALECNILVFEPKS